jgi:HEAT repeats
MSTGHATLHDQAHVWKEPQNLSRTEAIDALTTFEANLFADLHRCRWDADHAATVVPVLTSCLKVDDTNILHRALGALVRIGAPAESAIEAVVKLMFHPDMLISEVATHTLGSIAYRCPERAIKPLSQIAQNPRLQKAALFSLIGLRRGSAPAAGVFVSAFQSTDARIRRLAVRGLKESGVGRNIARPVLARALKDPNGQVRAAAAKLQRALEEKKPWKRHPSGK